VKINPYSIFMKWGIDEPTPLEILAEKVQQLEDKVRLLEEEMTGQSNALYECWNSLDARIDILAEHKTDV
jgi:hypothetical protein